MPTLIRGGEKGRQLRPQKNQGQIRIRRGTGERLHPGKVVRKKTANICKINLWGYVTPHGVGKLYSAHGNTQYVVRYVRNKSTVIKKKYPSFNSKAYLNVLKQAVPRIRSAYGDFNFVQDNASFHRTKEVLDYLDSEAITRLPHPACSPDLNIIENCWSLMQQSYNRLVEKRGEPKTALQLFRMAKISGNKIKPETVMKLYASMEERLRDVKAPKGARTTY